MRFQFRIIQLLILPLLLAALAACQPVAEPTPSPEEQAEAAQEAVQEVASELSLIGSSWEVESFGRPEDNLLVLPETRPTVNFGIDRYGGTGGCNWFLGVYGVDGEVMRFQTPATTRALCAEPPGVMEQEATYLSILLNITEYRRDGDKLLGFTVEDQQLVTFIPASPVEFEGTLWELRFFSNGNRLVPIIPGTTVTAQFDGTTISGSAGCNEYNAPYTLADEEFSVEVAASTRMACAEPDGVMDQEELYFELLQSGTRLVQTNGLLQILNDADEPILAFGVR